MVLRNLITLLSFLLIPFLLCAQSVEDIFGERDEIYFSFDIQDKETMNNISRFISIDRVSDEMLAYAYANKKGFADFMDQGIVYSVLQHPGTLHRPKMLGNIDVRNIQSWDFYPTYSGYVDMMYQFEALFPDICDVFSIGTTNNGMELLVARISDNVGQEEGEPEFFYTSSMHGDETTGYPLMLRLIDHLLNGYGNNDRLTHMVDEIDIYINPLANPDGSFYANNDSIYGAIRFNAMWVDLNRNFPDPEDGPHPDGNPWQTETIHFMNFAEEHNFVNSANLHGGTEVCNYPWDTWPHLSADDDWWVYVCREYADTVHVHAPWHYMNQYNNGITNGYQWYTIAGGRQDYMNYFHQCREFTLEISDVKLLPENELPAHWDYNYRSLLNYLEQSLFGIRGKITDSSTGNALKAEVYVLDHELDSSWVYSDLPAGNYHRLLDQGIYDIQYSKNGYYTQTFTSVGVTNRMPTVIDVELVNTVASIEEKEESTFTIYPNPVTSNFAKVKSTVKLTALSIYDLNGRMISRQEGEGLNINFLDVSTLRPGTYILRIDHETGFSQKKFVKK
ncbi:MAG: M14 family zinc carboxypeptidase [Bacteroidota bacterium]